MSTQTDSTIEAPLDIDGLIPLTVTPDPRIAAGIYRGALVTIALVEPSAPRPYARDSDHRLNLRTTAPWHEGRTYRHDIAPDDLAAGVRRLFEAACREIDQRLAYVDEGGVRLSVWDQERAFVRRHLGGQPYTDA